MKNDLARQCFKGNKNTTISWLLLASYAYYCRDSPILSDSVYDGMCKWVYDNWEDIEHQHKHLITKEDMKNGSLFSLTLLDYPNIVKNVADGFIAEVECTAKTKLLNN